MNFEPTETFNSQTEILPYFNEENLETINNSISSAENITETDLQQLTLTNTEDLLLEPQNVTTLISDWQENQSQQPSDEKQTDPLTGQKLGKIQKRSDAPANIIYPFPEPGDTLLTAYNIDSLNDTQTYSDFVDGYYDDLTDDYFDGNDYYRFALDQTSNMEVVLDNLQDDANLELLNSNGQLLQRSTTPGSAEEFISQTQLTAGDYYLRVYPDFGAFTPYDLTFNFETTESEDLAGNTRRQAYEIGELNGSEIFNDFVGDADKSDYFQFEIEEDSQLDISLDDLEANANIRLRNSGGRVIEISNRGGDNSELISTQLDSGEYYLEVYRGGRGENTEYELTFDVSEINSDLAGNTRRQAYEIGELNGSEIFNDFVGENDTNDFYKFSLNETSDVELVLSELSEDADLQLLNSQGQVVQSFPKNGTAPELIFDTLSQGTYYVQISPEFGANTDYELSLRTIENQTDIAGNSRGQAYNIGLLNGSEIFNEFVGENDTDDFYKFRLNETSDVELVLSELSEDADMKLLDNQGQVVQSFPENGTAPELIFDTLSQGTYYVQISPEFGANTDYELSLRTIENQTDIAGNSRGQAYNIGLLNGSEIFNEFVGENDTDDFYKFRLNETSDMELVLSELSEDADMKLLNSQGQVLQSFPENGTAPELIFDTLSQGTYYVQISPEFGANTDYQLSLFNWRV